MSIEEKLDLEEINKSFVKKESKERIKWAYETFKEGCDKFCNFCVASINSYSFIDSGDLFLR